MSALFKFQHYTLLLLLPLAIVVALLFAASHIYAANTQTVMRCGYSSDSGQPNPLGMRTFISVVEKDNATHFTYEQFPSPIMADTPMHLSIRRTLVMEGVNIQDARSLMRENIHYYEQLIGYADNVGFSTYDEAMVCKAIK